MRKTAILFPVITILWGCSPSRESSAVDSSGITDLTVTETAPYSTEGNGIVDGLSADMAIEEAVNGSDMPVDSMFVCREIDEGVLNRISGITLTDDCPVEVSDLRYLQLLHVDFNGNTKSGEMICHRSIADDLTEIFKELYRSGYPIESIRLVDEFEGDDEQSMLANNTSCFNSRHIGNGSKWSRHAYGMAVDINPLYNPLVKFRHGRQIVQPAVATDYVDRDASFPHKIDRSDLCYRLFTGKGFKWGGGWRTVKDYQHFEK